MQLKPAILLLGLRMPVMSGEEVIPRLRIIPESQHLPIIAISTGAFEHNRHPRIEAGADDFLTKPF